MKLSARALALSGGILCAGTVWLVGIGNALWPGYGAAFLDVVASIYPGYHVGGFGSAFVGALYALLDGAIGGLVFAWLYNALSPSAKQ
jgi:hypothetical protein